MRGGRREGAGRPKGSVTRPRVMVSIVQPEVMAGLSTSPSVAALKATLLADARNSRAEAPAGDENGSRRR